MKFNFAVRLNIQSKDLQTKFYMSIMIIISSLLALWIYTFATTALSEEQINSTTGFNVLRPRLMQDEINALNPVVAPSPKPSIKQ